MVKLKHRKIFFWGLIAMMAGSSMAVYSSSSVNFWVKTIEVVLFQQMATVILFLLCFGYDLLNGDKPIDNQLSFSKRDLE
jgi:predicted membrane protein